MSKKTNGKKDIKSVTPITGNKKPVKPVTNQPDQFFTKEEMSKKNMLIPGSIWYDILTYLNSRPRIETNSLCVRMEQLSVMVKPE